MIFISILILMVAKALPLINNNISSILFSRISALVLLYASVLTFNSLNFQCIEEGIGIYNGLFQVTVISHFIELFIYIIGSFILIAGPLSPNAHPKAWLSSKFGEGTLLSLNLTHKDREQKTGTALNFNSNSNPNSNPNTYTNTNNNTNTNYISNSNSNSNSNLNPNPNSNLNPNLNLERTDYSLIVLFTTMGASFLVSIAHHIPKAVGYITKLIKEIDWYNIWTNYSLSLRVSIVLTCIGVLLVLVIIVYMYDLICIKFQNTRFFIWLEKFNKIKINSLSALPLTCSILKELEITNQKFDAAEALQTAKPYRNFEKNGMYRLAQAYAELTPKKIDVDRRFDAYPYSDFYYKHVFAEKKTLLEERALTHSKLVLNNIEMDSYRKTLILQSRNPDQIDSGTYKLLVERFKELREEDKDLRQLRTGIENDIENLTNNIEFNFNQSVSQISEKEDKGKSFYITDKDPDTALKYKEISLEAYEILLHLSAFGKWVISLNLDIVYISTVIFGVFFVVFLNIIFKYIVTLLINKISKRKNFESIIRVLTLLKITKYFKILTSVIMILYIVTPLLYFWIF